MREAIDKLIDRVKSPRFNDDNYYDAINQAITMMVDDRVENIKKQKKYSFQSTQRLRDELYTLVVPTAAFAPTGITLAFPNDYLYLLAINNVINGTRGICRPTTFNEKELVKRNPFKWPTDEKSYYIENSAGWEFIIATGATFSSCELDYMKKPNVVSIGNENDKINAGAAVLTVGQVYMVYDEAVHNSVTYYEGDTFTAANAVLDSGTVILNSLITSSDMPEKLHEEICRGAGAIMNGTVEDWRKQQSLKLDNQES